MAEVALALDNNWNNRSSQDDQTVADLLRQQKNQEQAQQANAKTINSQMTASNTVNERLMSRVAGMKPAKSDSSTQATKSGSGQELAEALRTAKQVAQLAANPTPVGVAKVVAEEGLKALKEGKLGQKLTGELLKQSWMHLIDSFGLTLIYLNIHAWLGFLEGHKIFCKLGEEIKTPGKTKNFMGFLEMIGIIALDFVALLIILAVLAFINWLIDNLIHPTRILGIVWDFLFK
ncbi:MAG TPA: hypothetical protein PLC11_01740 [bacterium]|nr:hypothetical protein [bacterium]HOR69411.1 hypothetical protein [bacterium]HPL83442.1 hypothetical protein [bacterium]